MKLSKMCLSQAVGRATRTSQNHHVIITNSHQIYHFCTWICNIALGRKPNSYKFYSSLSSYDLLGKLLIRVNLLFTTLCIQEYTSFTLHYLFRCKMKTYPSSFLIFRVQMSSSEFELSWISLLSFVLKMIIPSYLVYNSFSYSSATYLIASSPLKRLSVKVN